MRYASLALLAAVIEAGAQPSIPIRPIGPILATGIENVGLGVAVRATSDGHVFVAAGRRQRIYLFDSTLQTFTIVRDSGVGTWSRGIGNTGIIPFLGDSTVVPDVGASALLIFDPMGRQIRSMAPPHAADLLYLGLPASFGHPAFDNQGRLVYRSANVGRPAPGVSQAMRVLHDSEPILRGDFDRRVVDTLAWAHHATDARAEPVRVENPTTGQPEAVFKMTINPFPMSDEWAMLSSGTIAIVRVRDYHVDWIDPDGHTRSTPNLPFAWRRLTDEEKKRLADSAQALADERRRALNEQGRGAASPLRFDISVVPDSTFPTYWPPIMPSSVIADLDNHLWILPTTSTNAANGFTYDVVSVEGRLVERVQLPKGRVIVGFGPHNAVYLARTEGTRAYIERATIR
ncbi:MAG TPA: hypothetical protein VIV65_03450 [Gemmatimonadaceae bacterium]